MTDAQVQISRIGTETIVIPIIGTAPLIVHKFSEKAKRQMLDGMQGRKEPKTAKAPREEYEASMYHLDDGTPGFPVVAFKAASVSASRFYGKSVPMTHLRQFIFMNGELSVAEGQQLVRLDGEPRMREDMVRLPKGGTDLRYRAEFTKWSTSLTVTYVSSMLTRDSLLSIIEAGGMGVGVGEWRPEKKGDFGTYQVDESRQLMVLADGGPEAVAA